MGWQRCLCTFLNNYSMCRAFFEAIGAGLLEQEVECQAFWALMPNHQK